ncbi:MAG: hypothetical protein AAB036_03435 [Elusimicrobiota bacterium]
MIDFRVSHIVLPAAALALAWPAAAQISLSRASISPLPLATGAVIGVTIAAGRPTVAPSAAAPLSPPHLTPMPALIAHASRARRAPASDHPIAQMSETTRPVLDELKNPENSDEQSQVLGERLMGSIAGDQNELSQDPVIAEVRHVNSYKGTPWSETEYNLEYDLAIERLRARGASAEQLKRFETLCAQAPLRGGRFNSYSGD